jgi:hypothetical protein
VTEIYRRSFELLRAKGYPAAESYFTSPFTRKVAVKFGFEELARRRFVDLRDLEGKPFIEKATEDQIGILMAIKLL